MVDEPLGKGCDCVRRKGRAATRACPGISQTKGMDEEQRWKETLLWREGGEGGGKERGREWLKEQRLSSSVFPEVRSAGGEKIKAETLAFEVRQR